MDGERIIEDVGVAEQRIVELETELVDVDPARIGAEAQRLDRAQTPTERMRLPRSTVRRLGYLGAVYLAGLASMTLLLGPSTEAVLLPLVPTVIALAFTFELMDSAAGMGFGTALAPVLFLLGYDPLQVTPVLLVSEAVTGLISGGVHHELKNTSFSFRPLNDATRMMLLLGGVGSVASIVSIVLTYFALTLPDVYIETYVAVLVLVMGAIGLLRARRVTTIEYRPRRIVGFAVIAGLNKGIGGGGYGPVVTLGQILSGVYEKSATAIASLAESIVSVVGVLTFVALSTQGVAVDLVLLPSVFTAGFLAAVAAPYLVRVVPNRVWRYVIPLYAFVIGLLGLTFGLRV
ncbi:sulfite exporter TauE/SafE family protein [Halomarina rubra]|uniref:Probable membrane transporter protein n=1 Tax=Halomarina rubra TaxID=2071873 RepID=A0ABD6AQ12_9EURY|nr:sulfite exporter TauE/SafE family protein [Halomarina rubra]